MGRHGRIESRSFGSLIISYWKYIENENFLVCNVHCVVSGAQDQGNVPDLRQPGTPYYLDVSVVPVPGRDKLRGKSVRRLTFVIWCPLWRTERGWKLWEFSLMVEFCSTTTMSMSQMDRSSHVHCTCRLVVLVLSWKFLVLGLFLIAYCYVLNFSCSSGYDKMTLKML